jgi:hypothetical protein
MPIDILAGSSRLREAVDAGESGSSIAASWHDDEARFRALRAPFLLYE